MSFERLKLTQLAEADANTLAGDLAEAYAEINRLTALQSQYDGITHHENCGFKAGEAKIAELEAKLTAMQAQKKENP